MGVHKAITLHNSLTTTMKFALLSVSYSGLFYDGQPVSLTDQIRKASEIGFDGFSIETKRPIASPLDLSKSDRSQIRTVAEEEGIEICAIESMSNFASPVMEVRENNLAMMREIFKLAHDLNVDVVKVFAAWAGIKDDQPGPAVYEEYETSNYYDQQYPEDLRRWNRAVKGIREVAGWADDLGITLALQNHLPVTSPGYEDALSMMNEVDRKNVKLCLDVPLFYERQSSEYIKESVEKCGHDIIHSHYGAWDFTFDDSGNIERDISAAFGGYINYEDYVRELINIGYDGYMVSEYCNPPVVDHEIHGVAEVDRATKAGLKYIKEIVEDVM